MRKRLSSVKPYPGLYCLISPLPSQEEGLPDPTSWCVAGDGADEGSILGGGLPARRREIDATRLVEAALWP